MTPGTTGEPSIFDMLWWALLGLLTLLGGAWRYILGKHVEHVGILDRRVGDIEANYVTRADLEKAVDRVVQPIRQEFSQLRQDIGAMHRRVDQVYRDMPKRKED